MTSLKPKLPEIPEAELTPLVQELLGIILRQQEQIEEQQEEIRRLKGHKGKPPIKPSRMDQEAQGGEQAGKERKRGPQRSKTAQLQAVDEVIAPDGLPADAREQGWRFKGYADYVVQNLVIEARNIRYRLEEWQEPDGQWLKGKLPASVNGHFGPELVSYILHQHHHQHVTQPLLLEQLHEFGIEISAGQLSHLLTQEQELFHQEKAQVLEAGLQVSSYLQTDDTGARHDGKNGYCTYIGNEFFAWFESTQSKSRVNFLSLLRAGHQDYVLNAGALAYMAHHKLPQVKLNLLQEGRSFEDKDAWEEYLKSVGISAPRHKLIATEGALVGSLLARGFPVDMGIVSDDAGQFNVFRHVLCWIHAERNINKLVPLNDTHAKQIAWVRCQIWDLYADLKAYKTDPTLQNPTFQNEIRQRFRELCRTRTTYQTLNGHLKRLLASQDELLRVLEDPRLPLHNNLSESDIREYVKRRKISGSTRSDEGRRCRDTFASLKKTCRKLGISFWQYLRDRVSRSNAIAPLGETVRAAAAGT
jgi:hypothetical protein